MFVSVCVTIFCIVYRRSVLNFEKEREENFNNRVRHFISLLLKSVVYGYLWLNYIDKKFETFLCKVYMNNEK